MDQSNGIANITLKNIPFFSGSFSVKVESKVTVEDSFELSIGKEDARFWWLAKILAFRPRASDNSLVVSSNVYSSGDAVSAVDSTVNAALGDGLLGMASILPSLTVSVGWLCGSTMTESFELRVGSCVLPA